MDTASFFILVSLSACGLYYIIPSVPLHLSAFSFAILCASFYGGPLTGTLMGVLSGLFISLCGVSSPEIFPAFSLFGAAAGFMRTKGKLFTAVSSSLIFALLLAYFYPSILDFTSGALLSAAAAVFILTPIKNTAYFSLPISESEISESEHLLRVKLHTASRLFSASSGFKTLSSLFKEEPSDFTMTSSLPEIMKRVKKRSCKNCGMSHYCWVRDFEKTKGLFSQSISIYENKGNLSPRDFSKIYSDFCIEPENLLSAMNKEFEIHKRDIFWQMKLKENRPMCVEYLHRLRIINTNSTPIAKN